jgi:hypothetical protein
LTFGSAREWQQRVDVVIRHESRGGGVAPKDPMGLRLAIISLFESEIPTWRRRCLETHLGLRRPPSAPRLAQSIFVALELSRRTWLITSLSPAGGEKMSKYSVPVFKGYLMVPEVRPKKVVRRAASLHLSW